MNTKNEIVIYHGTHGDVVLKADIKHEKSNVQKMHITNADRPVAYYSLDRILAIGYRVSSAEAIDFRKWATAILKPYLINGCAVNEKRLAQVNKLLQIVSRSDDAMISGVADVLSRYEDAGDC